MKIFLDTANLEAIKKWNFLVDGVTTNPTLFSREQGNTKELLLNITSVMKNKDVNVEVTEKDPIAVYNQAKSISELSNNIIIKIPFKTKYFTIIQKLIKENIKVNITLVFSVIQAFIGSKLKADYISPFIGRINDIGHDGINLISQIKTILDKGNYINTKIIAASIRSVKQYQEALLAGADIITVPIKVFEKSLQHPLTQVGIKKFEEDWQKLKIKKFP